MVTLLLDKYIGFGPRSLFIPFASKYKPSAVAWGIVALYLLVAVEVSSLIAKRIPRKAWHMVHLASFVVFITSSVHTLQAGTDRRSPYLRGVVAISLATVAVATAMRVGTRHRQSIRMQRRRELIAQHATRATPTLNDLDCAIEEVVRSGETRDRALARTIDDARTVPLDAP